MELEQIVLPNDSFNEVTIDVLKDMESGFKQKSLPTNPPRHVENPNWTQSIPGETFNAMIIEMFKGKTHEFSAGSITVPDNAKVTSFLVGTEWDLYGSNINNFIVFGIEKNGDVKYSINFNGETLDAHTFNTSVILSLRSIDDQLYLSWNATAPWVQNISWPALTLMVVNKRIKASWPSVAQPVFSFPLSVSLPSGMKLLDQAVRLEGGRWNPENESIDPVTVVLEAKIGN